MTQSEYKKKIDGLWKELSEFLNKNNFTVAHVMQMVQNNDVKDHDGEGETMPDEEGKRKEVGEQVFKKKVGFDLQVFDSSALRGDRLMW